MRVRGRGSCTSSPRGVVACPGRCRGTIPMRVVERDGEAFLDWSPSWRLPGLREGENVRRRLATMKKPPARNSREYETLFVQLMEEEYLREGLDT